MKEARKDIEFNDIENSCGAYSTQADLEAACQSNVDCLAYTMIKGEAATGTPDADGFKPWCLKSSIDNPIEKVLHNLYTRTSCKSKKTCS